MGRGGVAGILLTLLDDALFNIDGGFGGPGGSATATAPDGVSATIRALAQHGGNATATGGAGAPGSGDFGEFGGGGGGGGPATATAGKGGDGSDFEGQSKDAADGGSATATGGAAGTSLTFIKSRKGDATALGGNGGTGGAACVAAPPPVSFLGTMLVLSDPASSNMFVFNVPPGGSSLSLSSVIGPVVLPGGTGGDGGVLSADASTPDPIRVDAGIATVGAGGNGGDGGAGLPPGEGGAAGSTPSSGATQVAPVFQPGDEGGSCATPTPRSDFSVMARMTGSSDSSQRSMTLTGSAPWIDVAGTLEEDGTVSLTGNGTMAGTPNIDVSFSGTYDEQAGTLVGSYTMDPNKVISAGHPLVYSLNMEVPPTP